MAPLVIEDIRSSVYVTWMILDSTLMANANAKNVKGCTGGLACCPNAVQDGQICISTPHKRAM